MTLSSPNSAPASRGAVAFQAAVLVFILIFVLLVYTALHESGHALVGLLFGGTLTDFSANFLNLSAHVGIRGEFSPVQHALIDAAGVSLPIGLWAILALWMPLKTNPVWQLLRLIGGLSSINSLLAWIVIPLLVMAGQSPADDSANFVRHTGLFPPLVTGAALLAWLAGWALLIWRAGGVAGIWQILRGPTAAYTGPAARKALALLGILFALTAGLTAFLGTQNNGNSISMPAAYTPVAVVRLAEGALTRQPVYRFQLEQAAPVSFFFILPNLPHGPAEIILNGPGNDLNTFFRAPYDFRGGGTVNPTDLRLEPGSYEILLTFPQLNGQVEIGRK